MLLFLHPAPSFYVHHPLPFSLLNTPLHQFHMECYVGIPVSIVHVFRAP